MMAIKIEMKPRKACIPEPTMNGKIRTTPISISPVNMPNEKKTIPEIKNTSGSK